MTKRGSKSIEKSVATRKRILGGFERSIRSLLVETAPDALIALAPEGVVLYWSKGAENVYGYTKRETLGKRLGELIDLPDSVDESEQLARRAVEQGLAVHETMHRKKDGSAIYVDITAKAVRDHLGKLKLIAVSHKDVTELKVMNQGKMLEARYRGLLESMPDAIVVVNQTGRIVLVNGQAEELFGYARGGLLGKPVEILLPARFREAHTGHRTRYFFEPKTRTMGAGLELFAAHADGGEFPVEISLSPLQSEEGTFAMSAIRDNTDRRNLQEELRRKNDELEQQNKLIQQATRLKSEFLANMSHELRTPLNGIIGFSEILYDERVGPVSSEHKEYLQDILTSARHLLQLINDVLDLAKIEAGKLEFLPEQIETDILVGEVRNIVRTLAAKKRIEVKTEVDPALATLDADPRSLKQILYNYVSNALKFTPENGKVVVRVKPDGADHFRIEVEDTGIGIRNDELGRLFVEFQQLDASTSKQYAGTGLGLALTKKLVEAQGGRVGVRSAPGAGSTFHAILPRVALRTAPIRRDEAVPVPLGAPAILVIEDDANDRQSIALALRTAGYGVETVATGAEALVRCREQIFDAITLDMMLPDMSGRAVIEKLRERGLNQQTPVVVVTLLAHKGLIAGFQITDILSKPVSQGDLLSALERCRVPPGAPQPVLVVDD
ncbi:MAG TPA: PAS domain S-box protein, partial [Candidatus Saccharimonadales bacterium]|nr:PAS domain S-box protein [Candidatus Saccharimonadales bacterium]